MLKSFFTTLIGILFLIVVFAMSGFVATDAEFFEEGSLISSTFDTTITEGAGFNTITFSGTTPSNSFVEFQFASSRCVNGTENFPDCTEGGWGEGDSDYKGSDGTSGTQYLAFPAQPVEIGSEHHNKRYFRYKIILYSSDDDQSPEVERIFINWSP
jgi:hypothetical protein